MRKGEKKTTMQAETVFVLQGFFPAYKDSRQQNTPGRWSVLYAWCFACGDESSERLSAGTRARLTKLQVKAQGWTGIPGALNLHHDGLAYIERVDAHAAVKQIRTWKSCKYKVRVVRETVWKEVVIDDYPKESLLRPFYWQPGGKYPAARR